MGDAQPPKGRSNLDEHTFSSDERPGPEQTFSDDYHVVKTIGEGGIGRVILAFDKKIERNVAIKELQLERLHGNKDVVLARFVREAKVTGQLEHPGIVPIYELRTKEDGTFFYVMRYIHGITLLDAVNKCLTPSPETSFRSRLKYLDNFVSICDAVGYAHSKKIVHRDLKLSNVIIGEFGETVILDWGLAKHYEKEGADEHFEVSAHKTGEGENDEELTRTGVLLGTPSYMAPEQADSEKGELRPSTDVYSLGVILYMILTGLRPYKEKGRKILEPLLGDDPSPSPRVHGEFIPAELVAICEKAMKKDQRERFQNAAEMAKELKEYRAGRLVSVYAYTRMELLKRFIARNKLVIAATTAIIMAVIAGSVFAVRYAVEARRARLAAENALVNVIEVSESALKLSRESVNEVNTYFTGLIAAMRRAASGADIDKAVLAIKKTYPEFYAIDFKSCRSGALSPPICGRLENKVALIKADTDTKDHPVDFSVDIPVFQGGKYLGALTATGDADKVIMAALAFDPLKSEFQVWFLQDDGLVIYDENAAMIGTNIFDEKRYADYPEFVKFGREIIGNAWGVGNLLAANVQGPERVYRIAAWDTATILSQVNWKVIITYPYVVR